MYSYIDAGMYAIMLCYVDVRVMKGNTVMTM
jgi:hypothetical protein